MKNRDGMKASLLYVFGVMVLVAGCGREEPSAPASAGQVSALKTLVVARASEPEWLNPVAGHQHADSDMALFRGLFKVNAKNELVPDMASSWEVSPDGKVYTLRLRPDIKWHDGVAFSAEDVKFTITAIQDPKNHSGMSKAVKEIKAVEVVDPLTVRITLDQPLAPLLSRLKMGIIPKHALQGKDFNTDPFNYTQPVGTGPFKFKEWKRGEYLILEANPDFYNGQPKLDRVIYKFLPDPNVRLVQLKKGEIDIAQLTPKQVPAIKDSGAIGMEVVESADYRVMMFNFRYPLFQDVRVRHAIQYATDRKALVDGALVGYGSPAYGPLQFNWVSSPDIPRHDNDLKRAEVLLAEAGWQRGEDGVMEKNGQRLSFPLTVPANDPVRADLAVLLASQLKRAGIEAIVEVKDWSVVKISKMQALILGGGFPDEPDEDLFNFFASNIGDKGSNYSGYNNPRIDALLMQGRAALDPQTRKQIYQEVQKQLVLDPPYNYLVYLKHIYGVRKGVSGFSHRVFGHGTSPLWNIEEWTMGDKL